MTNTKNTDPRHGETIARVIAELERQMDAIDKCSYVVDVREKYHEPNLVLATVVDRSDALHALLFVRKVARDALAALPPPPGRDQGWQPSRLQPRRRTGRGFWRGIATPAR